ncbi:hypothetical protein BSL78_09642 [Apostichopus japonicus]|uniref:CIDE-N domain-containing protein n=1 Tax=Stichopus japonicus TaxID=307972 RepID=A0A2G8KZL1_STIJA|nr:hypothetical protein BSL78_09642 [Apostichopus japonicus]
MATNYTKTPYKVQKRGGTEKYGVMAGTFEELKAEGCKHLGLQSYEIDITLEDNTIVDTGYFQSLKPDTLLIFKSKYSEDKVKSLGESLEACSIERKPNIKAENLDADEDNYKDRREDDEKWFEGQNCSGLVKFLRDLNELLLFLVFPRVFQSCLRATSNVLIAQCSARVGRGMTMIFVPDAGPVVAETLVWSASCLRQHNGKRLTHGWLASVPRQAGPHPEPQRSPRGERMAGETGDEEEVRELVGDGVERGRDFAPQGPSAVQI